MKMYSTNFTDNQWQVIEKIINAQERKRKHSLRGIMDAILYIIKTGCQWRMLPGDFAPWQTVYYYFRKWKFEGAIEDIMETSIPSPARPPATMRAPACGSSTPGASRPRTMPTRPARG